ncbi:MAG: DsrE family protein [Kiritimatiellales bacterium]|nr:DsrE family protein [Kiritimatiellales bacterium]
MKYPWAILCMVAVALATGFAAEKTERAPAGKVAIILQAGAETHEGLARALHAVLYSRELLEKGYDVALIFDGAGTGWANELRKPNHKLHEKFVAIQELGVVEEICDYCAEAFDVKDDLRARQVAFLNGEYEGHPSIAKWIAKGYQIIVL